MAGLIAALVARRTHKAGDVGPDQWVRPRISESGKRDSSDIGGLIFWGDDDSTNQSVQVKSNGKDPAEMKDDDLILCSPTVPGFSYGNKLWGKQHLSCC